MEALIQDAMARAFFASAWADSADEAGESLSGCEIMDVMPATVDPAAEHAARTLAFDMERANGRSLSDMLKWIEGVADGDREPSADMFGHYAAMQAMGHGVGLADAFGQHVRDTIQVPYVEFGAYSLERDYFDATTEDDD